MNELLNASPINIFIISATVIIITVLIIKNAKKLSVSKSGIEISNEKQTAQSLKIVTEYADFKWALRTEIEEAKEDLHNQAVRVVKTGLNQYRQRLITTYFEDVGTDDADKKAIIRALFPFFADSLMVKMTAYLLDIYEKNHLANKNEEDLKKLSHSHYVALADLFKELANGMWIEQLPSYENLRTASQKIAEFVEGLVLVILKKFSELSETKVALLQASVAIDTTIRIQVQRTGVLPPNYLVIIQSLYDKEKGLDRALVEKWLGAWGKADGE